MKILSQSTTQMVNKMSTIGRYLDQPILVSKFSKAVPALLVSGSGLWALSHLQKTPQENKKKEAIKTFSVLSATIGSALLAPRLTAKILKGAHDHMPASFSKLRKNQGVIIDEFLQKNKVSSEIKKIFTEKKNNNFSLKQVNKLFTSLSDKPNGKEFLNKIMPNPENIDSKHIFGEIKRLSILGLVPVLGGITGGIAGDKLTEENWKERIPNKIKEGSYQYLANIFMCNVGAGAALWGMEKAKITSKAARAAGMISGIVLTGIVGGSAIANFIGKKLIDPVFESKCRNPYGCDGSGRKFKQQNANMHQGKGLHGHGFLYSERKPEALDIGLHVDDIATVAVLSGLKWIEPALPMLYSISGFRAGIGYRNGEKSTYCPNNQTHFLGKANKKEVFNAFS